MEFSCVLPALRGCCDLKLNNAWLLVLYCRRCMLQSEGGRLKKYIGKNFINVHTVQLLGIRNLFGPSDPYPE